MSIRTETAPLPATRKEDISILHKPDFSLCGYKLNDFVDLIGTRNLFGEKRYEFGDWLLDRAEPLLVRQGGPIAGKSLTHSPLSWKTLGSSSPTPSDVSRLCAP